MPPWLLLFKGAFARPAEIPVVEKTRQKDREENQMMDHGERWLVFGGWGDAKEF